MQIFILLRWNFLLSPIGNLILCPWRSQVIQTLWIQSELETHSKRIFFESFFLLFYENVPFSHFEWSMVSFNYCELFIEKRKPQTKLTQASCLSRQIVQYLNESNIYGGFSNFQSNVLGILLGGVAVSHNLGQLYLTEYIFTWEQSAPK